MFIVTVKLKNSFENEFTETEYNFKCLDSSINIDDIVLVDTKYGIAVAKVTGFNTDPKAKAKREVICICDTEKFDLRKQKREKLEELEEQMNRKAKDLQKISMYELLSEKDIDLKYLLDNYKKIKKELEEE